VNVDEVIALGHLSAAVAALVTGGLVGFARKGTRTHGRLGWVYALAMVLVNGTALLLFRLTGAITPFHVAAVLSLATLIAGLVPVLRRSPEKVWLWRHATWMAGSYVGLWAAAVAETVTRLHLLPFWWAVAAASMLTVGVGTLVMSRTIPASIRRIARSS